MSSSGSAALWVRQLPGFENSAQRVLLSFASTLAGHIIVAKKNPPWPKIAFFPTNPRCKRDTKLLKLNQTEINNHIKTQHTITTQQDEHPLWYKLNYSFIIKTLSYCSSIVTLVFVTCENII